MGLRLTVPRRFDGLAAHAARWTLRVADGRIAAVDAAAPAAGGGAGAVVGDPLLDLDLGDEDATLLPGLVDAHVHLAITNTDPATRELPPGLLALRMLRNGHAQLRAGVTTVRDLGAPDGLDEQLRRAYAEGLATGPRLFRAGRPLVAPGGHAAFMGQPVASPDDARRAVAAAAAAGVDWVKLMATAGLSTAGAEASEQQLPDAVLRAAVAEAHAAGLPAAAHAVAGPGVRAAILAGVDSLEHGYALGADDVAAMRDHGTTYVPTRTVVRQVADALEIDGSRPPARAQAAARLADATHADAIRRAHAAGVPIVAGTDYQHGALPLEVALLVAAGLTPTEALRAATSVAARLLRRPDLGTLAPGARADLLVVCGDPLRDVRALRAPLLVVLGGAVVWCAPALARRGVAARPGA
ncbi:MAG: amidohydrolase family protein [Trueperaceae bacterium]|nr:amidohydrolase family protein [Trueperaceae bacterium]